MKDILLHHQNTDVYYEKLIREKSGGVLEGKKFKEILFWELNEPYLRVESFAKIMVEDNQLPSSFENEIIK